jgi:hypothetical protein
MKWVKRFFILLIVLGGALALVLAFANEKRPAPGVTGEEADALARKIHAAVGQDKWDAVGALKFGYADRHTILWDKQRGLARVDFSGKRAMFRTSDKSGLAWEKDAPVADEKRREDIIADGYRWFINDTFWLNPFASFFDASVTRSIVTDKEGEKGLLIAYSSGGVTPGDAYLWYVGPDGLPNRWKMWVSVLPIGGLEATWENWVEIPGGPKISTKHHLVKDFGISELKAGPSISDVEAGDDPFAALFAPAETKSATVAGAASQPSQ